MAAADVPRHFALSAVGVFAPTYEDPVVSDGHSIGPAYQEGVGGRVDCRYRLLPWFAFGIGVDYLQSTHADPSHHMSVPFIISFVPLRVPYFELGASLGLGPAWSWYTTYYGTDGTLRGAGAHYEVRLEPAVPITRRWAVLGTLGARLYSEEFSNPVSYAAYGSEGAATAIDFGLGIRLSL